MADVVLRPGFAYFAEKLATYFLGPPTGRLAWSVAQIAAVKMPFSVCLCLYTIIYHEKTCIYDYKPISHWQVSVAPVLHLIVGVHDTDWNVKERCDTVHATGFSKRVKEAYCYVSMRATGHEGERWYCKVSTDFMRLYRFILVYKRIVTFLFCVLVCRCCCCSGACENGDKLRVHWHT